MKKTLIMLFATTVVLAGAASWARPDAGDTDLMVLGNYMVPEDDDVFDEGWGGELQVRFWITPSLGIALAGGYAQWEVDERRFTVGEGRGVLDADLDGEIDMVPVGASLLLRPFSGDRVGLVLEGGARYVFIDSDTDVRIAGTRNRIDVDDAVIAVAAATIEIDLTEDVFLAIGGGYQWDVDKGDAEFLDEDFDDIELEAAFAQAGIGVRF